MTKFCRRRVQFCLALSAGMSASLYEAKLTFAQQNPNDQTVFFNANDASGASSFNSGGNWQTSTSTYSTTPLTNGTVLPAGTAPTAGYAYVVTGSAAGTGQLRTPTSGNVTFAGDSLTLVPYVASTNTYDVYPVPVNFAGNTASLTLSGTTAQTVTVNDLVLANGGTIQDVAGGTATIAGTINFIPAGTTLDGITTTVSGGAVDLFADSNGIVSNATFTGTGVLHVFSSNNSGATFLSLNSANGIFSGGFLIDDSIGSSSAGSSNYPLININNPLALGSGTLTFPAYPAPAIGTAPNGPSIDNGTGAAETLTSGFTQAWNGNFIFKGSNYLNTGSGAVTVGNTLQVTVTASTLFVPAQISGSNTLQISGAGVFETPQPGTINLPQVNIASGATLGFAATTTTPAQFSTVTGSSVFVFQAGSYLGVDTASVSGAYNLSSTLGSGVYGLRKVGTGTLLLSGTGNAYSGATNISTGTLQLGNASAIPSSSIAVQVSSGTILDLNGNSPSLELIAGPGIVTNTTSTPVTLTISNGGSPSFTGNISNGAATTSLNVNLANSSASFNMSGATNTYTGSTTLTSGTLIIGGATSLAASDHVVFAGGTLAYASTTGSTDYSLLSSASGGNPYSFNIPSSSLNISLGGAFTGAGGLTKIGSGILTLTGTSSTYTGPTAINAGTLAITSPADISPNTSGIVIASGANLNVSTATATTATLSLPISGAGNVVKVAGGTLVLSGTNGYTGTTNISAGVLQVGSSTALGGTSNVSVGSTGQLDLNGYSVAVGAVNGSGVIYNTKSASPVTLTINLGSTSNFAGNIANGAATTSLNVAIATAGGYFNMASAANAYTGATTLTAGTLLIGAKSLAANDPVIFNGGTLGFIAQPNNDPSFNFSSAGGNPYNFNVPSSSTTITLGANLSDGSTSTSVTMSGSGTLILSGTNTYTGTTTINSGVLAFATPASLPPAFQSGINVPNLNASVGIGNNTSSFSFGVPVTGAGGLVKVGSDTVTLTSTANTYTGGTNVSQGTLVLGNANALGSTGFVNLGSNFAAPNGTLDLNGFSINLLQPLGGAYGGVVTNSNTSTTSVATIEPTTATFLPNGSFFGTFTGNLSLVINFPAVTSSSSAVETFGVGSVGAVSTYTGSTTLQSGVLAINTPLPTTSQSIYFNGGQLQINTVGIDPSAGFAQTSNQQFAIIPGFNNNTLLSSSLNSSGGSLTIGSQVFGGNYAVTLAGANNFSGPTTVLTGVLQIANPMGLSHTSGVNVSSYQSSAIGSTPVAGILSINDSSGYVGLTGGVAGGAPITLTLNGMGPEVSLGYSFIRVYHQTGIGFFGALQGTTSATVANPDIWAGNVVLAGNGPVGISGGLNYNLGQVTSAATGGALEVSGVISGTGPLILGQNPLSTTILAAANTYTGETQINSSTGAQTTVQLGTNNAIPAGSGVNFQQNPGAGLNNQTYVYGSEILDLNGYNTSVAYITSSTGTSLIGLSFPAISGVVTNSKAGTTSTLTILGSTSTPYTGVVNDGSGKVAINFAGTGLETLSGTNNYSGGTTVTSGTVVVPGLSTLGTGNITINGGGLILQQTASTKVFNLLQTGDNFGKWNGPGINSAYAAADSAHLTAVGMFTTSGGTSFRGQSLNPGDVALELTYYGDANLDGKVDGSDYSLIDAGYASGGSLTGWQNGDFNYDGSIDGSDYALIDNAFNNQGAAFSQSAIVATATAQVAGPSAAVPEPAGLALAAVTGLGLLRRRRSAR